MAKKFFIWKNKDKALSTDNLVDTEIEITSYEDATQIVDANVKRSNKESEFDSSKRSDYTILPED